MEKLKVIDEMAFGPLFKGADTTRNQWWKEMARKTIKREGKKGLGKFIPILCAAMTVYGIADAAVNVTQLGWEEAAAESVNEQFGLDNMDIAREVVRQHFKTGLIAGGTPIPVLRLPNGQEIGINERTYKCNCGVNGVIGIVEPYVISEIKVFPDGTSKVAAVMEVPPFTSFIVTDPTYLIRDYWPRIGDSYSLFLQARARAIANPGGNP